ncbi:hypothetical protein [Methyloversatilis thermotolerans]|uniref:hypothetical protein n=1 Tax=Methyloversatilis thermotolerans TaxID=1346290 RepID=UPI0003618C94|nr:hypothetical protein [Methyloversatilis thermotolerans]
MSSDKSWTESSKPVETLNIEICFLLQGAFYVGNPNSHEQITDPKYREPLSLPDFARANEKYATTAEIFGNEEHLIAYYKQIVERGALIGRSFNELRSYFWLRLLVWNEMESVSISFPWYDSLTEIRGFTNWLASPQEEAFRDIEQGWQVDAVQAPGFLHIRELDPDSDERYDNVKVALSEVATSANLEESRAQTIIERLSEGLGVDV